MLVVYPEITLYPSQTVDLHAQAVAGGVPIVGFAEEPTWSVDREDLITLTVDGGDPLICTAESVATLPVPTGGTATVKVQYTGQYGAFYGYTTIHVIPTPPEPVPDGFDISVGEITDS